MADNLTNVAENRVLDWLLLGGTPARPVGPLKVGLFTTLPALDTGLGGSQPSEDTNYVKQAVTFTAAVDGVVTNSNTISFPMAAGGDWGTIVGIGIYDATEVLLLSCALLNERLVEDGDTFRIAIGELQISLA